MTDDEVIDSMTKLSAESLGDPFYGQPIPVEIPPGLRAGANWTTVFEREFIPPLVMQSGAGGIVRHERIYPNACDGDGRWPVALVFDAEYLRRVFANGRARCGERAR